MVEWDIPNWVTLVTEVAVGIAIAILVLRATTKYEKKNQETLDKIQEIENEQSNLIKEIKPIIEEQEKLRRSKRGDLAQRIDTLEIIFNNLPANPSDSDTLIANYRHHLNDIQKSTEEILEDYLEILTPDGNAWLHRLKDIINSEEGKDTNGIFTKEYENMLSTTIAQLKEVFPIKDSQ